MKYTSVKDKLPWKGQTVKYKGEIWRFGAFQHITKGKCKYNGKYFETPDDAYQHTDVTHWAE